MKSAMRVAALFTAYTLVGYGGEYGFALLAQEFGDAGYPVPEMELRFGDQDEARHVDVEVHVDVDPEVVVDVQVRNWDSCSFEDERSFTIPASLTETLAIRAGSGGMRVEGRDGIDEVQVVGRLCASHEEFLDDLRLTVEEIGSEIVLSAHYPQTRNWRGNRTARIDLAIAVPTGMSVDIEDSSGDISVFDTGDLRIQDSSGGIEVSRIRGSVWIDDSSGGIEVNDVAGDVQIEDGSGGIDVLNVQGSVLLDDGSGGIAVSEVGQDVLVEDDGSGSISVSDVSGDFRVVDDGSGSIRHSNVDGDVSIPQHKKKKKRRHG